MPSLLSRIAQIVRRNQPQTPSECLHVNYTEHKWLDKDGTPMIYFRCHDCNFTEEGHVHADPKGWCDHA